MYSHIHSHIFTHTHTYSRAHTHTTGINVVMITGDKKETAVAVAREVGLLSPADAKVSICTTLVDIEEGSASGRELGMCVYMCVFEYVCV
jgi:magnesium-transporting ATPase (P-type)